MMRRAKAAGQLVSLEEFIIIAPPVVRPECQQPCAPVWKVSLSAFMMHCHQRALGRPSSSEGQIPFFRCLSESESCLAAEGLQAVMSDQKLDRPASWDKCHVWGLDHG